jgi:hypothetical protein
VRAGFQQAHRLPDGFCRRVSGLPGERWIHAQDDALGIGDDDRVSSRDECGALEEKLVVDLFAFGLETPGFQRLRDRLAQPIQAILHEIIGSALSHRRHGRVLT